MSGFGESRIASAVSALVRIEPSGWFISCAIEAVSSPAVEKRLTWASSAMRWRACTSALCRRRCSCSKIEISPACIRIIAPMNAICHEYRSHAVGSRK